MPERAYDCIVIGSGPGGYVAAIRAAQLGMKTAVVEKGKIGGRCLNYACIPAKAVLRVADILSEIDEASDFGISVPERTVDFAAVGQRRAKVVKTLTGGVAGLMKKNKIDVLEGEGGVTSRRQAPLGDEEIEAQTVILATGSVPKPIPGTEFGGRVIGTEEAWALEELPGTLAVVGAGASGAEIASAYGRMGTDVLLFEALDRVLPTEDADISKVAGRGALQAEHRRPHRDAGGGREARRRQGLLPLRRQGGRGRLARDRRRPRARHRGARAGGGRGRAGRPRPRRGGRPPADVAGRRLRHRRPRPRSRARPQGVRRGHHRRGGRRRARRSIRSSTRTSRAPPSAPRTSPRSG